METTTTTTTVDENCNRGRQNKEDFCFVCFGGGDLLACDIQYCPKAYHCRCINHGKSYSIVGGWKCEWHTCNNCEKAAHYFCCTCTYSLCKWCKECTKEAEYSHVKRGKEGFCKICMEILALIEKNDQGTKEMRPTGPAATTVQNIGTGGKKAKKRRHIPCKYCGKKFKKDLDLLTHTQAKHSTTMACFDLQSHTEAKHGTPAMNVSGTNNSNEDDEDAPNKRRTERKPELIIGLGGKKSSRKAQKQALNIVCKYCGKYFWKEHSLPTHIKTKHNNAMF